MQIAKWGNSLAVRIPVDVARELGLKEGDDIELCALDGGQVAIARREAFEAAREAIRSLCGSLPADYKFDREEANAR
ncbi:AbrB/MazE/SpoVT family DNA-binding domain-containing protein [Sphingomonas koreensis]|nr:AbrB/MazE/SpoVT family DNA-binding domain-containing protein [Sphingomonas koreensis]